MSNDQMFDDQESANQEPDNKKYVDQKLWHFKRPALILRPIQTLPDIACLIPFYNLTNIK
jgi:hypothetical protein